MPLAARSKAWVCDRSFAGIVGMKPAEGTDACLVWMLGVVRYRFLCRADHSSRAVLPSVMCLTKCDGEASIMGDLGPLEAVKPWGEKKINSCY